MSETDADQQMKKMSRRSFLWGAGALTGAYFGWQWLIGQKPKDGFNTVLKQSLDFNDGVGRKIFSDSRLAPTFPANRTQPIRTNGSDGLSSEIDLNQYEITLNTPNGTKSISLAEVMKLPRHEMTVEFKCVEGWSRIVSFSGVLFSEFLETFAPGIATEYVSLETPDSKYYVGLDIESVLHPQTLLADQMNGKPLKLENGAPLRLAMPVKYGYKQLKRVGKIELTNTKPKDFWAEEGYDWYGGH